MLNIKKRCPGADWKIPYRVLSPVGRFIRIVTLTGRFYVSGQISREATALTYYTLFSIIPFAALSFGIAKGFALDNLLRRTLQQHFAQHQETLEWIYRFADSTLQQARGGLIAGIGVIFLLLTVVMLASNVENIFNNIWMLPPRRNMVRKFGDYLAVLLITPLLLVLLGGSSVATHSLINNLAIWLPGPPTTQKLVVELICGSVPYVISWAIFSSLYAWLPNTRVGIVPALTAGILVGTVFQLLQSSVLLIQIGLSRYNAIYGSFALLPLLLMWMQWSWRMILFGAELSFVMQYAGSGRFEVADLRISHRERREYLLEATRQVALRYARGQGATSVEELCQAMGIAAFRVSELLNELEEAGVLLAIPRSQDSAVYVPAFPADQLTPMLVLSRLDSLGDDHLYPDETAMAPIREACNSMEQAMSEADGNRPLIQITAPKAG